MAQNGSCKYSGWSARVRKTWLARTSGPSQREIDFAGSRIEGIPGLNVDVGRLSASTSLGCNNETVHNWMSLNSRGNRKRQVDRVSAVFGAAQSDVHHIFRNLRDVEIFSSEKFFNTL